jgi:predicted alpha/beta hydrolase family esterase
MSSTINYLIIHGIYGHDKENWFPWLGKKLEAVGGRVAIPNFPTPEGQTLENWTRIAEEVMRGWDPANTILIGHSAGAVLALRLAEKAARPYKAIFAASPFARPLEIPEFDPYLTTFVGPFDWKRIKAGAGKIACLAGDDDPIAPLTYARDVADNIGVDLIVIPKGGHLNEKAGYTEFPLLLEKILHVSGREKPAGESSAAAALPNVADLTFSKA